jgi:GTP-binding protein
VLIDSRLSPQKIDLEFLHWMVGCGLPFVLLFTKSDKLSDTEAQENIEAFVDSMREITEERPEIVNSSAKLGKGRSAILALIASALAEADSAEEPA